MRSVVPNLELVSIVCSGASDPLLIANILESISDSVLVLGEDGDVLCCNRVTEEMLGYSPEQLLREGLGKLLFSGYGNEDLNQIFVETVSKKSVNAYKEVDYCHPDGSLRRLAATTSYLVDVGEHETSFSGFVVLLKDVTEVFNLRRKEKELIQEKHKMAKEKIRSLQKLAMGVAHEIRNPTVTIGGFASRIVRAANDPEATKRYANSIIEAARTLENVVDAVQQCCDLPEINPSYGNISNLLHDTVSEMKASAGAKNVNLRVQDELPKDYAISFDPFLLRMAIVRLIQNAIDFSPAGAAVDISLRNVGESTVLEVRDYGAGIKEEDIEYIFNPFFSTLPHGSGMGLAVVESVVNEHLGSIQVDSKPGRGTIMRVLLPRSQDDSS